MEKWVYDFALKNLIISGEHVDEKETRQERVDDFNKKKIDDK